MTFGIEELIYDCSTMSSFELVEKLEKYKGIDKSFFVNNTSLKNSPLNIFFSRTYLHELHSENKDAEKVIHLLQELGDRFNNEMCLRFFKKNVNIYGLRLIDKYNQNFDYDKYFNEVYSFFNKRAYISVDHSFFIYNKYSTNYLERDTNLFGEKIIPLMDRLVVRIPTYQGLNKFMEKVALNPKEKDLSIDFKNTILVQLMESPLHEIKFEVIEYLLDTPGMDFEALEPLFLHKDRWIRESYFSKDHKKKFGKILNYFQAAKMNQISTSEFNL